MNFHFRFRHLVLFAATMATSHLQADDLTRESMAKAVLQRYSEFSLAEKQAAVAGLGTQIESAHLLLDAVAAGKIPRADISSFVARQIVSLNDEALKTKLEKEWGRIASNAVGAEEAAKEAARWAKLLNPSYLKDGSRSQGRVVYKTLCGTCHTLFGDGGLIGPDLTGSNRADLNYILENVTNPNAIVGLDYELNVISLKDGRSVAGMVRQKTNSAITIQTMTTQEVVPLAEITSHTKPGISMMPAGLLTAITQEQVRDLMLYLASPSQVPLPGEKGADGVMKVAGAQEGEALKVLKKSGNAAPQNMKNFKDSDWSGGAQLWWTGGKPGDRMEVAFTAPKDGHYRLNAVLTRAVDYAVVKFQLDGKDLSENQIDLFGTQVTNTDVVLGERTLTAGEHRLTVEITGANPAAVKSYMFGLDYLMLTEIPKH